MAEVTFIPVRKHSVGFHHADEATLLMFEWTNRKPINLMLSRKHAVQMAQAILENYKNPPPPKNRQN